MWLHGAGFKAQHNLKVGANADMTGGGRYFALALDGVSGVPAPYKPEDASFGLRETLMQNLKTRFDLRTNTGQFDDEAMRHDHVCQNSQKQKKL